MHGAIDLLLRLASAAGIEVPDDIHDYKTKDFQKWFVFANMQLQLLPLPLPCDEVILANAKLIASYDDKVLMRTAPYKLLEAGFVQTSKLTK